MIAPRAQELEQRRPRHRIVPRRARQPRAEPVGRELDRRVARAVIQVKVRDLVPREQRELVAGELRGRALGKRDLAAKAAGIDMNPGPDPEPGQARPDAAVGSVARALGLALPRDFVRDFEFLRRQRQARRQRQQSNHHPAPVQLPDAAKRGWSENRAPPTIRVCT